MSMFFCFLICLGTSYCVLDIAILHCSVSRFAHLCKRVLMFNFWQLFGPLADFLDPSEAGVWAFLYHKKVVSGSGAYLVL